MYYVYLVSIKLILVLSSGERIMLWASVWLLREEVLMLVSPANPAYTEEELLHQLTDSGAKGIVTTPELLDVAVAAGRRANIPRDRIILFKEAKGGYQHYTSLFSDHEAEST